MGFRGRGDHYNYLPRESPAGPVSRGEEVARDSGGNTAKTCWFERMQQECGHAVCFYASEGRHAEISAPFSLRSYHQRRVFPQKGSEPACSHGKSWCRRSQRQPRELRRHLRLPSAPGELPSVAASFR